MQKVVYLFPDTNLFFQCKSLDQLDWSRFGVDRVELIVTRPINAEIDSHKGKGNGRTAKRARKASSVIGQALIAESDFLLVKDAPVEVRLRAWVLLKEDDSLHDRLSYSERDHQLVGIASEYAKKNADVDVRVLTYDNGVLGAARGVGVKFERIPDDWLLEPESDEKDKQILSLQQQIKRYQDVEPRIEIELGSLSGQNSHVEFDLPLYLPLTDSEVERLVEQLKMAIPEETGLGSEEEQTVTPAGLRAMQFGQRRFEPSTDEEIADYKVAYRQWLAHCELHFRSLNEKLNARQQWPEVKVNLRNVGSRPADDALVSFFSEGTFLLTVPADNESEDDDDTVHLPPPPVAPKGRWVINHGPLAELQRTVGQSHGLRIFDHPALQVSRLLRMSKDDPNDFYFRGGRPSGEVKQIELTCQQWRHQMGDEPFRLGLHWQVNEEKLVKGSLRVDVRAANIADMVSKRFPVRLSFTEESTFDEASALIELLSRLPGMIAFGGIGRG